MAVGYPHNDKSIYYDCKKILAKPKTFSGKFKKVDQQPNYYEIYDTNWEGKNLEGFSGSPIIYYIDKEREPILLGILTNQKRFLSINLVTDTIIKYLHNKIK